MKKPQQAVSNSIVNKKLVGIFLATAVIIFTSLVEAQPQSKVAKIGWLGARSAATAGEQRELFLNKRGRSNPNPKSPEEA